jgi:hypothetical protein
MGKHVKGRRTKLGAHHNEREIQVLAEKLKAHCDANVDIWKHVPTLSKLAFSPPASAMWLDLTFLFSFLFMQEKADRVGKNATKH